MKQKHYEDQMALNQRRNFLKFIGKAGVSLPVLQASALGAGMMLTRQAEAQGTPVRKVVFIYIPDGTPKGASHSFTPDAALNLKACSMPLASVKNECVFLSGMSIDGGGGHGNAQRVLGAFASGVRGSVDLALGDTVGASSPIASLRMGVRTRGSDPISARGFSVSTDTQDNPEAVFDRLFGGAVDASPIGAKREKKILEMNQDALNKLKTKLGSYEAQRLDQHQSAIAKLKNDIELAANAEAVPGCDNPTFNPDGLNTAQLDQYFGSLFNLQVENLILALRCNITRVGVIQLGTHQADFNVDRTFSVVGDYHGSVHSGNETFYTEYRAYFSELVARLITRLKNTDDASGGKLLDNTLVVQISDMGDGDAHTDTNAPFMVAGGGAAVNRGRLVAGANHHRLLDTAVQFMGANGVLTNYDPAGPLGGILV